jgi:hypothetical protein
MPTKLTGATLLFATLCADCGQLPAAILFPPLLFLLVLVLLLRLDIERVQTQDRRDESSRGQPKAPAGPVIKPRAVHGALLTRWRLGWGLRSEGKALVDDSMVTIIHDMR